MRTGTEYIREFHGVTEPCVDLLAVLLHPRAVVRHGRVVVEDLGGAGEHDDAAAAAVAVEVERDPRLPPDVREPLCLRPVLVQQAVAAVPEKPDRVRLRGAVTPDGRQPDRQLVGEAPADAFAVGVARSGILRSSRPYPDATRSKAA